MKSRWKDNDGRDAAIATSDTPDTEAEPERKTAVETMMDVAMRHRKWL